MKVALPVVRGLHGSRAEGTTRRFKVGDFETEFNGLGVLRTDIRTVPGRRRGEGYDQARENDHETYDPSTSLCVRALKYVRTCVHKSKSS